MIESVSPPSVAGCGAHVGDRGGRQEAAGAYGLAQAPWAQRAVEARVPRRLLACSGGRSSLSPLLRLCGAVSTACSSG